MLISMASLAMASCSEGLSTWRGGDSREMRTNVYSESSGLTRSSSPENSDRMLHSLYEDFSVVECIEDLPSGISGRGPETKGRIISTGNITSARNSFIVEGFLDSEQAKENPHFIDGITCTYANGEWRWPEGCTPVWRDSVSTILWSYSTRYGLDSENDNTTISISPDDTDAMLIHYSHPEGGHADEGSFCRTNDLLVAYNNEIREFTPDGKIKGGKDNSFSINFQHALAAVKFSIEDGAIPSGVGVKRVILSGFSCEGDCIARGSGDGSGRVSFEWTPGSDKSRTFVENTEINDIRSGSLSGTQALFMIPQSLDGIKLTVTFVKSGYEVNRSILLGSASDVWQAGKSYTYKIKATVHFPGERLRIGESFRIKGFAHAGGTNSLGPFEAIGVNKIAIWMNHSYRENSGHGSAKYYLASGDGQKNTIGSSLSFDLLPVPGTESIPYMGGDGIPETYVGVHNLGENAASGWEMYDISGFRDFCIVCHSYSSSNDGRWEGEFSLFIIQEVVNEDITDLLTGQ